MACPAYVGEATPSAGEYHCNDFDWEEHRQEVLEQLATRQVLAASSAPAESALPAGKGSSHMRAGSNIKAMPLQTHHDQLSDGSQPDARSCHGSMKVSGSSQSSSSSVAADSPQQLPQARSTVLGNLESVKHQRKQPEVDETAHDVDTDGISQGDATVSKAGQGQWQYDSSCWESFHAKDNATARFYKERRYVLALDVLFQYFVIRTAQSSCVRLLSDYNSSGVHCCHGVQDHCFKHET